MDAGAVRESTAEAGTNHHAPLAATLRKHLFDRHLRKANSEPLAIGAYFSYDNPEIG
jgi:hypothetical protein